MNAYLLACSRSDREEREAWSGESIEEEEIDSTLVMTEEEDLDILLDDISVSDYLPEELEFV